ncbi:growth hormone secretagogue receptor type 1-like [Mugil cephalus]|uniref:growth hormone secretagogue receptor type 1-like n=1 Tax=Mugil cephalus TaxID=48193 RepID=UPI001FB85FB1|nr:growth hormone secretagogue receptor type 1-like [Mugil cephalus]
MDLMELGDTGGSCDETNCGLGSGFIEDCSDPDCHWDEPMFGLNELVCVTVIYIPLMLFGLLGNILTIMVVWLRPHMRSSTYLYLSSMAVSDLLILLLLPLDLYKLWRPRPWPLGDLACKLTMFLSECCTFCTILHITFLSLERYLAVCWPITAKTLVTRRRTRTVIGCLWVGAAISAAPVLAMVGVEEVGGEELSQWREDGWFTSGEREQSGFIVGGGERGRGHVASVDGGLEGIQWGEKEEDGLGERVGELKWFEENKPEDVNERNRGEGVEVKDEKQADGERGKMEFEEEQQNNDKEDEGRGRDIDRRECRCTHYAVTSGLLSAMMILSNLYFLVPLCVLALVYSLIGRTLWLRPKNSRRDQTHRHTVKMLGVIVLAFVLCWLPFHVGRTIFSLSLGTGTDSQETYVDNYSHPDMNTPSDVSVDSTDINNHNLGADHRSTNTTTHHLVNKTSMNETPGQTLPIHFYDDDAHTDFNNTYSHPDAHLYFLYYLSQYFNLVSSVLFYLSAAINPLMYNLMSARYRHAVHSLVHKHTHTQAYRLRTLTTRHSTTTL